MMMDNQFYNFGMSLNVELVNNYNFIKYQYICQAPATFGTGQLTPVLVYGSDPRTEKLWQSTDPWLTVRSFLFADLTCIYNVGAFCAC